MQVTTTALFRKFCSAVLAIVALSAAASPLFAQANEADFSLFPNPKFISCLGSDPQAQVKVTRGNLNDTLVITGSGFKPRLAFDMFTTQRSNLLSDGTANPNFTNFGLAWYQSDLEADEGGNINAKIETILLDQIFGFDAEVNPAKFVNTFHVGFWFNNPNDANVDGCVFDVTHPTPFNGEHKAGPNAMMSVPDAKTKLGPLCTNRNTGTKPPSCNP